MSTHYNTEPTATASATLHTTLGPIHIALFASQTPLTCRNFLQHISDNYYTGTIFHRIVPNFILQGGDPTGTGSGGTSIYEDPLFEYDAAARDPNEKVVLRDELHSRLRFNRRGLLGMAKSEDGSYGSQFFITLGDLGPLEGRIVKRDNKKGGKTLLSFGDEEGEEGEEMPVRAAKPKYNAALVTDTGAGNGDDAPVEKKKKKTSPPRRRSPTPPPAVERPKTPDPAMQLPLPDPESPERSPSPEPAPQSRLDRTNAEIESLKASMRRTVTTEVETGGKKSALEAMIPQTAIRGRRRPAPGTSTSSSATNGITGFSSSSDNAALKMFNAFKAKLEGADAAPKPTTTTTTTSHTTSQNNNPALDDDANEDEESQLCDLHFIANCQSCQSWSDNTAENTAGEGPADDSTDLGWLTHQLRFGKDTLGKDLNWKKEHPDDLDSLMVIDPREKEREIVASGSGSGSKSGSGKRRGLERDRERDRKRGRVGDLEWEKSRR
ncbi:putative peptidyl-prolyl cis-trans isomerase [Aspergillus ibericus CBS 121593]|uniref:PPIase cyclophilin-type domain-containing protein n=1 Tax=Aspergillus ibericus CBS 121593 TaxID=1448316 RepID=A0A395GLM0_9EURO|nr:hypothetical protein BO80DRAFT_241885 [Aspergillus ibericus CBS 121593]RAK96216.1 hypothetical protein BO80DRAFT_241885 [Aspergillus ibericus CBS 121593]